jgi:hypothetical protein
MPVKKRSRSIHAEWQLARGEFFETEGSEFRRVVELRRAERYVALRVELGRKPGARPARLDEGAVLLAVNTAP